MLPITMTSADLHCAQRYAVLAEYEINHDVVRVGQDVDPVLSIPYANLKKLANDASVQVMTQGNPMLEKLALRYPGQDGTATSPSDFVAATILHMKNAVGARIAIDFMQNTVVVLMPVKTDTPQDEATERSQSLRNIAGVDATVRNVMRSWYIVPPSAQNPRGVRRYRI